MYSDILSWLACDLAFDPAFYLVSALFYLSIQISICLPIWSYLAIHLPGSVYLSVYPPITICLSVGQSVFPSLFLFLYHSTFTNLASNLSIYSILSCLLLSSIVWSYLTVPYPIFFFLSIYLSVCLSFNLPKNHSINLPAYQPTYLCIYLSIYLSICLSVCLSVYSPMLSLFVSHRVGSNLMKLKKV